jgi:hypothetical protein
MLPEGQSSENSNPAMTTVAKQPVRQGRAMIITVVLLVLVLLIETAALVMVYGASEKSKSILESARQKSYQQGQSDQKRADEERFELLNRSPYRSYKAPIIFGGFEIKFPKNWNVYSVENSNSPQQINLTAHPDFVKQVSGIDNVYALRVLLVRTPYDQMMKQHQDDVKQKKIKLSSITISGIEGSRYEGKFDGKHDGSTVLLPVRDKTIVIATDDKRFLPEFNQILTQANIVP